MKVEAFRVGLFYRVPNWRLVIAVLLCQRATEARD